jgi:prepilin-type processing-associated H-X9-DG protein
MYATALDSSPGPWGPGVFFVTIGQNIDAGTQQYAAVADITDGTSNTLLLSEGLKYVNSDGVTFIGSLGDIQIGNMGGPLFSAFNSPNSPNPDWMEGVCPPAAPCQVVRPVLFLTYGASQGLQAAARSRHPGGVNAALADGSVRFFSNSIALTTWRSLGTRAGGEVIGEW